MTYRQLLANLQGRRNAYIRFAILTRDLGAAAKAWRMVDGFNDRIRAILCAHRLGDSVGA